MEHKKSKWVGLLKIAVLSYCSLLGKEGIDLFVNQDDTNLRIEDMEQAVTNSKFALVETGENQVGVYRRDNGMQLTSFNITDYDLAGFDRRAIKKPEEYDKDNVRIAERIALIDGVAFRETFDCKTGKSMYFDPIESDNRNTYHALHGAGELVDFINVLSGGKLLLTNHEHMNDNGVFEIFDMEHGEIKTGTGMGIIKDYVKDMKFAKDDLTQALRNTATKEQLKVEKQVFEKDDILIGDKVDKDYVCYDKSILDYCVMDGDKLVVENPEAIHAIPKDKVIEDVLDTVEGLDVDNKDELAAQTLEFVTDESTRSSDVTRFYDFILMSQYNDGYRRKYMETMKKNLDKRINKDIERAKLDPEEFSKMDDIEKIIALQKVEADQENKLDVAVYYNGLSEKKEAKATAQIMDLINDIQFYKNYVLFNKVNNALEMKAIEREERERMQKAIDNEARATFKNMGIKEEVNIVMSYTEAQERKTMDGQERLMFDDNGKISIGTEHIKAKRNYEKAIKLDEEEETNDNNDIVDITNIFYGEDEETVSSEEMDQIELSSFIDMDGNDNEDEVEMSADSIELND